MDKAKHIHTFTRSKPTATVETCTCGKFRHTEHAGEPIIGVDNHAVEMTEKWEAETMDKAKSGHTPIIISTETIRQRLYANSPYDLASDADNDYRDKIDELLEHSHFGFVLDVIYDVAKQAEANHV